MDHRRQWSLSGVREVVRCHRLYAYGEYTWGQSKRSRKKNSKLRLQRAANDDTVVRVQNEAWKIVDPALAHRALDRTAAYNAQALRSGVGEGKAKTQFVSKPEMRGAYLLSGLLRCGARKPDGKVCGAQMVISVRGRRRLRHWACSAYKEKRDGCRNNGAVLMSMLDAAVVASLRSTFSQEAFETYLPQQAANTAKIAEHHATRTRLVNEDLPRLAKIVERLTKRLAQTDDDDVAAVIQNELKDAVQEREGHGGQDPGAGGARPRP